MPLGTRESVNGIKQGLQDQQASPGRTEMPLLLASEACLTHHKAHRPLRGGRVWVFGAQLLVRALYVGDKHHLQCVYTSSVQTSLTQDGVNISAAKESLALPCPQIKERHTGSMASGLGAL